MSMTCTDYHDPIVHCEQCFAQLNGVLDRAAPTGRVDLTRCGGENFLSEAKSNRSSCHEQTWHDRFLGTLSRVLLLAGPPLVLLLFIVRAQQISAPVDTLRAAQLGGGTIGYLLLLFAISVWLRPARLDSAK